MDDLCYDDADEGEEYDTWAANTIHGALWSAGDNTASLASLDLTGVRIFAVLLCSLP